MKVYQLSVNDEEENENTNQKLLPVVNQGEILEHLCSKATENYNNHPPRYNEASLVKGVRNRMIRDSFDGDYRKVSRRFGISTAQVRNIVNYK